MEASPSIETLAAELVGRKLTIAGDVEGLLTTAAARDDPLGVVSVGLEVNRAGRKERWSLEIRLTPEDLEILAQGALDAYQQVVLANIAEWWHTGSTLVVTQAVKDPG